MPRSRLGPPGGRVARPKRRPRVSGAYEAWLLQLGERVYARRESLGLKQRELGALAGTSENTISNLERGLVSPNMRTAWAIREALGLSHGDAIAEKDVVT